MTVIHTKTFKSGNSVAVRLPKALAIAANETLVAKRSGNILTLRRIPSVDEEAARLARWRGMLDELRTLGPVGDVEVREPIVFPERPGL